jgi:predicted TIM-barrel fold metal-dependent hydrolase
MLYNENLPLPTKCYNEPFLNKDLLAWAERNDGTFWIEFVVDPRDELMDIEIKLDSEFKS